MIPNNVVSFMKKMVTAPEGGQDMAAAPAPTTKLSRLKQTLSTGLQQAQESVAKFSPKRHISAGVGMARRLHNSEGSREQPQLTVGCCSPTTPNPVTDEDNPVIQLSTKTGSRGSPGPLDRSTSCRVCVRSLIGGDVAHRICSQCNLKVCEDCASYSNVDKELDQSLWRCSICRRKSQDALRGSPTVATATSQARRSMVHRWSEENLPRSSRDGSTGGGGGAKSDAASAEKKLTPSSAPVKRRERLPRSRGSDDSDPHRKASVRSVGDFRRDRGREASSSTSASESSLEETELATRSVARRQNSMKAPLFLSTSDAERDIWRTRRFSSESSDASDASSLPPAVMNRGQQDARDDLGTLHPVPSMRRRSSFRAHRSRHFCDVDVSDGYDADEQSITVDSTPSPVSCEYVAPESHLASPRRSRDISSEADYAPYLTPSSPRASRGSLSGVHDIEQGDEKRRNSSTLAGDAPVIPKSPRQSVSYRDWNHGSADREAIRIVIDDVDSGGLSNRGGDSAVSSYVARLCRNHSKAGQGSLGFGVTLIGGKRGLDGHLYAIVARVESGSTGERAGLCVGDCVIAWDGVRLTGLSFEEVQEQVEHSGDSIQVEIARNLALEAEDPTRGRVTSPTRRRLPQAPSTSSSSAAVFCRVQLKLKLNGGKLNVTVIGVEDVVVYEDVTRADAAFAWLQMSLVADKVETRCFNTDQLGGSTSLYWNTSFCMSDIGAEDVTRSSLRLVLWEETFRAGKIRLAETTIDLTRVSLDGRTVWYPMKDSGGSSRSPLQLSPSSGRRLSKAFSHDVHPESLDSDGSSSMGLPRSRSAESNVLLHPEAALSNRLSAPASLANSRRGSAQTPDVLQARSLPPSRRGSNALVDTDDIKNWEPTKTDHMDQMSQAVYNKLLSDQTAGDYAPRRSHSFRVTREVSAEHQSLSRGTRNSRSARILNASSMGVGPGQVPLPEGKISMVGQLKLALIMTKGQLEVEVIAARNLPPTASNTPPDTYVKIYLSEDGRLMSKRKTRIMRQTSNPQFHQTLVFEGCDAIGRSLVAIVCEKAAGSMKRSSCLGSSKSRPVGVVQILLDRLSITTLTMAWYRLIPPHLVPIRSDSLSDDSF